MTWKSPLPPVEYIFYYTIKTIASIAPMLEFTASPSVYLLKQLVPNSLKQSLAKAVRLWVILRSLYGADGDPLLLELDRHFTHTDWETFFFSNTHTFARDRIPKAHDAHCHCALKLEDWLFKGDFGCDRLTWYKEFCDAFNFSMLELETFLKKYDRLFSITGKTLEADFESLVKLGCLHVQVKADGTLHRNQYIKVETLPAMLLEMETIAAGTRSLSSAEFIQSDLYEFVDSLAQPIQGVQRFYLHADYIVSRNYLDQVSDFQVQLKACWEKPETPPIALQYESAREHQQQFDWMVYPVCVFYYQRAPYLFGFGYQVEDDRVSALQWYDFRLDHILDLTVLDWADSRLTAEFLALRSVPPTPDDIHDEMAQTWGFEFYRSAQWLILRFDRYFYSTYIEPTERAALFTKMTLREVCDWVERSPSDRKVLQSRLAQVSAHDQYCRVKFRVGDRNILMRLRAWGFNVEVILPIVLRQEITAEVEKQSKMYGG
jgi:CRISPR-associated protein (TIGR03985 family)